MILDLLKITLSPQSKDYVQNKKQYQLHTLLTEQRHPVTWDLSQIIKEHLEKGLQQIFTVDKDITRSFSQIAKDTARLEQAAQAVSQALKDGKKIFLYGCGATGRLAKHMECAIWRPFWNKLKTDPKWGELMLHLPDDIEDRLIGEMTGGDRALISSMEGLEDLQLVGKLQLQDRGYTKGDIVFCITEGGETSSVIGAILAAADLYEESDQAAEAQARKHLYFLYNNPDEVLIPFERSRQVIENPAITKINLTSGPQAIAGSTRMQATTSETFIMGIILERGIFLYLQDMLNAADLAHLGFTMNADIKEKLDAFESLQQLVQNSISEIAKLTSLETRTYQQQQRVTYFAKKALIAVFTDCTERSPTFHISPLDTVHEIEPKCWFQIWTEASDAQQAWQNFLGRNFRGLSEDFYRPHFFSQIEDVYLKRDAMVSLSQAGNDQEKHYDFSFSHNNIHNRGPRPKDLGVVVCVDEEIEELAHLESSFYKFIELYKKKGANIALVFLSNKSSQDISRIMTQLPMDKTSDVTVNIPLSFSSDPMQLKTQTLIKMLLNGHSTAVMASMGRVVGNTMTNVYPSNLKLIGRATYLILSHVNELIAQPIAYAEANAVLFAAMDFCHKQSCFISEVELSIIRILEGLRTKQYVSWEEALAITQNPGLENYLEQRKRDGLCQH